MLNYDDTGIMTTPANTMIPAASLLQQWLQTQLSADHSNWLEAQLEKIRASNSDRELHITLGLIPRKFGRSDLTLSAKDLADATAARPDWNPANWSIDTAARIYVLCKLAQHDPDGFDDTITDLCRNADLAESIALYSGIALYPQSDAIDRQVGEGLRSNMRAVFEAIAHNNPYPAAHFDENRWNHMVLKALFIDSTLAPIQGLDKRANAELAIILRDYAHERWAAARPVTVELWRCVGPFASGAAIDDLQRVTTSENSEERNAGLLALSQCPDPKAAEILAAFPQEKEAIANGAITWDALSPNSTPPSETTP